MYGSDIRPRMLYWVDGSAGLYIWIDSFMTWSKMKAIRSQVMQASGLGFGSAQSVLLGLN